MVIPFCYINLTPDGQLKSSNIQQQAQAQTLHPSAPTPAGVISKSGTQYRFHWSHAFLAVGFLAVSGAGTAILFKVLANNFCGIITI